MKILARGIVSFIFTILVATTAAQATESLARQVLSETNLARTDPKGYAEHLKRLRGLFDGNVFREPGSGAIIITHEGVAAVDEAIKFLSRQHPVPALRWSSGLAEAAEDLVRDQGHGGETGHTGRRSGDMRERIERHGTWSEQIGENINYGSNTARMVVMELIIDDGVSGRGHRKNIFAPAFAVAGVACGPHPRFRMMCVTDFAGGYRNKEKGEKGR